MPIIYCVYSSGHVCALTWKNQYHPNMLDSLVGMGYIAYALARKFTPDPALPDKPQFPGLISPTGTRNPDRPFGGVSLLATGMTALRKTRKCEDADFTPFAGLAIDLEKEDLSGIVLGKANFTSAKLTGARFSDADISQCRFDKSALRGNDLRGAWLVSGDFRQFDFTGTNLNGANLSGANLTGATLDGATLENAKAAKADFTSAVLKDCKAVKADLQDACFQGATLTNVSFADASLQRARFNKSGRLNAPTLKKVDFGNADLASTDFSGILLPKDAVTSTSARPKFGAALDKRTKFVGATVDVAFFGNNWSYLDVSDGEIVLNDGFDGNDLNASFAILSDKHKFAGKRFVNADFESARLSNCNFGNCDLTDAKFNSATLFGADFTTTCLEGAQFMDADLTRTNFSSANLWGAKFSQSLLIQTNFSRALLAQVDFTAIRDRRMSGVNFSHACLVSAKFRQTEVNSADSPAPSFSCACLLGADFTGASLKDAVLTSAKLSEKNGHIEVSRIGGKPISLDYEATLLPPDITGERTRCPDGSSGPCSIERLRTTPVPTHWS